MSAPAQQRRHRQREEARRTILDATEALLIESGYDGFSMRRLAAHCGYTAPTIYHHFGDKPGLLDALLEERFGRLLERLQCVDADRDPVDTLRELIRGFVEFGLENPPFYRLLMLRPPEEGQPPATAERAREMLEGPVRDLTAQRRLRVADVDAALQTIWAMAHGVISLSIHRPDLDWSDDLTEVAIETLVHGLIRPQPTPHAPPLRGSS